MIAFDQNILDSFIETADASERFSYSALRDFALSTSLLPYACHEPRPQGTTKSITELARTADQALACPKDERKKAWMIMCADSRLQRKLRSFVHLPLKEFLNYATATLNDFKYGESAYSVNANRSGRPKQRRPERTSNTQNRQNAQNNFIRKFTCAFHTKYGSAAYNCQGPSCNMYPPQPKPFGFEPTNSGHNQQHLN